MTPWQTYGYRQIFAPSRLSSARNVAEMSGSRQPAKKRNSKTQQHCRQLHYLLTMGMIHIHPAAASPNQGVRERGMRLHRGVREMDVLRGDKEWRDGGKRRRDLTKGVVKNGTFLSCASLPPLSPPSHSQKMPSPKTQTWLIHWEIPASGNSS